MTRVVILLVLFLAAASRVLDATLVIPVEFRQIVAEATLIVRGRITDVRGVRVPDRGVESIGTIAVDGVLKGDPVDFVSVRVPGGTVGRYRYVMVGAPRLRAGEHAVFFLKRGPDDAWRPIGLTQGIFRVQPEPQTGRPIVHPPLVAGRTVSATGRTVRGDPRRRLMPVSEFESLVRFVLASPPGQAQPRGGGR